MNLLIKKIYDTFAANQELFVAADLPPVQTIDIYRGQPINPEQFELYGIPALFLDYNISWERVGKTYNGTGRLDVHVVTDQPWGTADIFTNHEEALKKVFYYKLVRLILDDLESENTGKLTRLDERPVDTGVICYHVLAFNFAYYEPETIGSTTIEVVDADLVINRGQLVKNL